MPLVESEVTGFLTAKFGCRYVSLVGTLVGFLGYGINLYFFQGQLRAT